MRAPLEVRWSRSKQVGPLVLLGVFFLAVLLAWVFHVVPGWLGALDTVLFGGVVVYGLVSLRRIRPDVAVARLDEEGVTVPGARTVPWSDLRQVVVGPMRPAWFLGSRRLQVVSFLPHAGADLPGPPGPVNPQRWGRGFRERLYGTNLLLLSSATSVDGREIAQAAHELGGLPVRHVPFHPVRRWLVVLGGAVVLGVAIAVVRRLVG
ncbi:hypothetical protein [Microlunatus flavus]|uniref:hypothetical protein n=1 Tax=Microlunatus flavus TaxID=1036181 RepID=UPI000B876810|nr:hypothetical protein [Microlunatus flavus]